MPLMRVIGSGSGSTAKASRYALKPPAWITGRGSTAATLALARRVNGRRHGVEVQAGQQGDELRIGGDAAERAIVEVEVGSHPPTNAVEELLDEPGRDCRDDLVDRLAVVTSRDCFGAVRTSICWGSRLWWPGEEIRPLKRWRR
jgi:hypothetical protein